MGDGPLAEKFAPYLGREERFSAPRLCLYEVYKKRCPRRAPQQPTVSRRCLRARVVPSTKGWLCWHTDQSGSPLACRCDDLRHCARAGAHLVPSDLHFRIGRGHPQRAELIPTRLSGSWSICTRRVLVGPSTLGCPWSQPPISRQNSQECLLLGKLTPYRLSQ